MQIQEEIRKCIEESGVDIMDNGLLGDFDSITFIEMVLSIEDKFGFELPDRYLNAEYFSSLDLICQIVENNIN